MVQKTRSFRVRVQRQDQPDSTPYWQEFEIAYKRGMNVISVLQEIAAEPTTVKGEKTTPVAYEAACLENVCGSCSMRVNGRVRQACNTLVDNLLTEGESITLEPMSKFPTVRDLVVNRTRMFDALKKIKGWIAVDNYGPLGEGPRVSPEEQEIRYPLSRCMTCGCCLEVCPQINDGSAFIGPQAIAQAVLFNMHPTGKLTSSERVETLMGVGGISDCGNAQNCVKVCPKEVPLTWAIGKLGREATVHSIRKWFLK